VDFDLSARAHRAMHEAGFRPEFGGAVMQEVAELSNRQTENDATDLTHLNWSSIDNEESRDLDQLEYAEKKGNDNIRLMVAISSVIDHVRKDGPIYLHAAYNTTSVYTGVETFHMLPEALSTDRTSLLEGQTRLAMVVDLEVTPNGDLINPQVYRARVQNHARLTYEEAGEFMQGNSHASEIISTCPWLREQLSLQMAASHRLISLRKKEGALTFSSFEPRLVKRNGKIVDLKLYPHTVARELIESFMVAVNISTATYLKSKNWPIIERVVTAPRRWGRIREVVREYGVELPLEPEQKALSSFLAKQRAKDEVKFQTLSLAIVKLLGPGEYVVEYTHGPQQGHFGLAVDDYSHSTAPNRRFADLVLQKLLRACSAGQPMPYSDDELQQIAARCTERETAARKVERLMRKVCAATLIRARVGQEFSGMITGASRKGTYARLFDFPAEGKVVRGERGVDVGDRVRLRLLNADPETGFIDLERL
jgi:VacB/RNase II family 3'-5' exoribonuclease